MKIWISGFALCAVAAAGWWLFPQSESRAMLSELTPASAKNPPPLTTPVEANSQADTALINSMIDRIKQELGDRISQVSVQVELRDFRDYLVQRYPAKGNTIFTDVIEAAFPQYAETIITLVTLMDRYEAWLMSDVSTLVKMSFDEKQAALWAKRRELFGANADLIWSDELEEREQRIADTQQSIELLNNAYDMDINQRLFTLKATIENNFAEQAGGRILSPAMMANTFFSLDSVQTDLASMSPFERAQQLTSIRRDLGYNEAQLEKAALRDQENEFRWQIGYQYMGEREALKNTLSGKELETALNQLRNEYFDGRASTLAKEEQQGFYRFNRPRVFGRN
ncbi:hypothetical protein ACODM8_14080 [Vibrio ostreicida]|uniref:Lipase modulator n=1 Tax=Vibrio ostreicida TaxID=526588 RepID=A0ABT8BV45_9VIBR|nr:hypothetical protein [Vibrio ostreicida]MDN3610266.1 hypothetical protein [Vibrio ostreicida]NPD07718.1 hypothetical protein [Vibrio ostreicida]